MKLILFVVRIALVFSRPIGKEKGEKHEALTGDEESGYDLGLDEKRIFKQKNQSHKLGLAMI